MSIIFSGTGLISSTGIIPIQQGGTNASDRAQAINNLLPSQANNQNKILSTDGTNVSWIENTGGVGGDSLPPQDGNSGYFLSTDGTVAYWTPVVASGVQASGTSGKLQYNFNNALTGTAKMSYNDLDVLFLGDGTSDTFKLVGVPPKNINFSGTSLELKAGDSFSNPLPEPTPPAGNLILTGGGSGSGDPGSIIFKVGTVQTETFRIVNTGAWSLGGATNNVGESGQVLISNGSTQPPAWQTLPIATSSTLGLIKVPANNGLNLDSSGSLTAVVTGPGDSSISIDTSGKLTANIFGNNMLPTITSVTDKFLYTDGTTLSWKAPSPNNFLPSQSGNSGKVLSTDGNNVGWSNIYPDQTGNSGKLLTTNGTSVRWDNLPIASNTQIGGVKIDGTTIVIDQQNVISASIGNLLPTQTNNSGNYLTTNGTTLSWGQISAYTLPAASSSVVGGVKV